MNILRMAWKNLWRTKRRTLITVASICFGVVLATLMRSLQDGTYSNMIKMSVQLASGYIQLQHPLYQQQKSINHSIAPTASELSRIAAINGVQTVSKRLSSFALFSSGSTTKGGSVIGIEPDKDAETSNIQHWVAEGRFLNKGDRSVLLTQHTAQNLHLGVHDTLVLISQGYHGVSAAAAYPIKGIVQFATPKLNHLGVFMDLGLAQEFFDTGEQVSAVMITVDDYNTVPNTVAAITAATDGAYNVLDWKTINPDIVQFIESDQSGGMVMIAVLYIVIGFGIFGTIIMMVAERKRELGVLIAIGMQKVRLYVLLFCETILIGVIGVIAGFSISVPIVVFLKKNPVQLPPELATTYAKYGFEPYFFFGTTPTVFLYQVLVVFGMTALIAIYPLWKVKTLEVTTALRS